VRADFNLLHLQSAETESVIWVEKILASTKPSLLYGELVVESPEEVRRKTAALQALPSVAPVESIASVIPADQDRKPQLIADLRPWLADLALLRDSDAAVDVEALSGILGRITFKMAVEGEGTQDAAGERLLGACHKKLASHIGAIKFFLCQDSLAKAAA
jgi:hypothetical protein